MKVKVFLIPYAGADISCYDNLKNEIINRYGNIAEPVPIELSGHGKRRKEPLYNSIEDAAKDVISYIQKNSESTALSILYGQCSGGAIAYETYRSLKKSEDTNCKIKKVILASTLVRKELIQDFDSMIQNLIESNLQKNFPTLPQSIIKQLYSYMKPAIDQESSITKKYMMNTTVELDEKCCMLFGKDDTFIDEDCLNSQYSYLNNIDRKFLEGDHFFLNKSYIQVADIIGELAQNILKGGA